MMLKRIFDKIKYEACILIFLLAQAFTFAPSTDSAAIWPFLLYLNDYSHGYMPRALLGEIFSWFTPTISIKFMCIASFAVCVVLCLLVAIVGGHLIRKAEQKPSVIFLVALWISSPIFMPLMSGWLGIVDIYFISFTLIAFIINENKFARCFVPVIMLTCFMLHQAYIFLYMVPMAIALLYDFFKNKKYIRDGLLCGFTYISLIVASLITLTNRTLSGFNSTEEIVDYMIQKADFEISRDWLTGLVQYEHFSGMEYMFDKITTTMSIKNLLGIFVIFLPIFVLFAYGWIRAIRNSEKKHEKFILSLCLIHPLSTVPAYILGLNWNRWTSAIITSQCLLYLFMLYRKNESVTLAFSKIYDFIKKHFIVVVLYLIYYASFAKLIGF